MTPEDRAQALELQGYERNQAKAIMPVPSRVSAKWCVMQGCGERIPDARRQAVPGVQHCLECQGLNEKMKGRHASAN